MSRTKTKPRIIKNPTFTYENVRDAIFAIPSPYNWRTGQFVFNRAAELYGDALARSVGYDPFYNDENIKPFINALVEVLNKSN
jgi:hypothetical protein